MAKANSITLPIAFQEVPVNPKFKDLTGMRFHRYLVLGFLGRKASGSQSIPLWACQCDCGNICKVRGSDLKTGATKSCGCYSSDFTANRNRTHGMSHSLEYSSYRAAKERCENPRHKHYKRYGGNGVRFEFASFEEFYNELGPKPTKRHSVDRIDTLGNYSVGNVRWATSKEQSLNKRGNKYITIGRITRTLSQWAESQFGDIRKRSLIGHRIAAGWCETCSVMLPAGSSCPHKA